MPYGRQRPLFQGAAEPRHVNKSKTGKFFFLKKYIYRRYSILNHAIPRLA